MKVDYSSTKKKTVPKPLGAKTKKPGIAPYTPKKKLPTKAAGGLASPLRQEPKGPPVVTDPGSKMVKTDPRRPSVLEQQRRITQQRIRQRAWQEQAAGAKDYFGPLAPLVTPAEPVPPWRGGPDFAPATSSPDLVPTPTPQFQVGMGGGGGGGMMINPQIGGEPLAAGPVKWLLGQFAPSSVGGTQHPARPPIAEQKRVVAMQGAAQLPGAGQPLSQFTPPGQQPQAFGMGNPPVTRPPMGVAGPVTPWGTQQPPAPGPTPGRGGLAEAARYRGMSQAPGPFPVPPPPPPPVPGAQGQGAAAQRQAGLAGQVQAGQAPRAIQEGMGKEDIEALNVPWDVMGFDTKGQGYDWAKQFKQQNGYWPWEGEGDENENLGRNLQNHFGQGQQQKPINYPASNYMAPGWQDMAIPSEFPATEGGGGYSGGGGGFYGGFGGGGGGGYEQPNIPPALWRYLSQQQGI